MAGPSGGRGQPLGRLAPALGRAGATRLPRTPGIAAGPTWLTRRRSLDSGRGLAGRTSGQMARGPGGVGDPRAHHGRRAGLTLGAAPAGVRAPRGPADGRTGRAVLRAGTGSTRAS